MKRFHPPTCMGFAKNGICTGTLIITLIKQNEERGVFSQLCDVCKRKKYSKPLFNFLFEILTMFLSMGLESMGLMFRV